MKDKFEEYLLGFKIDVRTIMRYNTPGLRLCGNTERQYMYVNTGHAGGARRWSRHQFGRMLAT